MLLIINNKPLLFFYIFVVILEKIEVNKKEPTKESKEVTTEKE